MNICEIKDPKTWNHPHRSVLAALLNSFSWLSLMEIGCGYGANLVAIIKSCPQRQLGGTDENPEAISAVGQILKGGVFKTNSGDDLMMSDKATDVALSDKVLCRKWRIKADLLEIKRITRKTMIICELHEPNLLKRIWFSARSGRRVRNWRNILSKLGFYDVMLYKMPKEFCEEELDKKCYYIIKATVPKRG